MSALIDRYGPAQTLEILDQLMICLEEDGAAILTALSIGQIPMLNRHASRLAGLAGEIGACRLAGLCHDLTEAATATVPGRADLDRTVAVALDELRTAVVAARADILQGSAVGAR